MGSLHVDDPCLGTPYLELGRDLSLPLGLDPKCVRLGGDWDFASLAQGNAVVPAGRNIKLMVMLRLRQEDSARIAALPPLQYKMFGTDRCHLDPDDLSGLSQLGPDDLYMLNVSSLVKTADADRRVLEPISHLTGLQILCLHKTGVTDKGMEYLKELRSLRALELYGERIGVSGLAALKDLPALEYLDLNTDVTDADLKQVAQLSNLRWLRMVTENLWGQGLAELANLPRLERLCLWGGSMRTDRHIQHLEGLTHLKSLTLWGSACNRLTDTSLVSIGKLKNLEELYFIRTSPRFTVAGVARLKDLKNLKKLDFAQMWISPEGVRYGDVLARQLAANFPNLESIKGISFLSDEGMKMLATFRNLKCLGLALKDDLQGYHGPTGLSHLAGLGSLEELYFTSGKSLSDTDMACLESLGRLKHLHVRCENLTDRGMVSISKLSQLEHLNISGRTRVSKRELNQLSGLRNLQTLDVSVYPDAMRPADGVTLDLSALTNLKTLELSGVSLQDTDLASLSGLHNLEWLILNGTFTEEGLWHLRDLSELKFLNIRGISCSTGDRLDDLGGLTKLGDLKLRGRITDAALGRLTGLPSLWSLSVETDESIRPETLARLKKAMPTIIYMHMDKPLQMRQSATREDRGRSQVSQPRVNRRTQQNRRRRR
jgi:Leucine-rich repeat (LRR) protein